MKKIFYAKGLSCKKCKARIFESLKTIPNILSIKIKVDSGKVIVESLNEISDEILKNKVAEAGNYTFSYEKPEFKKVAWKKIKKYYPLFTILSTVALISLFFTLLIGEFHLHNFMRFFMAFFFLVFGGLKFINPMKFAEGFSAYDPLANKFPFYAKLYPFIEITLGLIYLLNIIPFLIPNIITILILSITNFGIFKALEQDKELKCACLGGFFSLPISWVTLFENFLMIGMALYMIF